ncbi:d05bbbb2-c4b2-4147-bae4-b266db64c01c [Sclerotinia trifoliorum]|uniref:D05bbbb2-c4b2-4147-bae4-b266db64c01c n=1 Tax=Sclerotinia trifoliorum TaxID=28548 RepID=A0A8H2VXK6_9HELO|nr:d05bbbb2-c4b2-4147-bae4-b266db64c01c [Sclerotinia trifoliorum]
MDHWPILPISNLTASPISTSGIDAPQAFGARCFAAGVPKEVQAYRGKAITEADWPTPVIYRLYISENLTFPKVKEALNVEFKFNITEKENGNSLGKSKNGASERTLEKMKEKKSLRVKTFRKDSSTTHESIENGLSAYNGEMVHDTISKEIPASNNPGDTAITGSIGPRKSNQADDDSSRLSRLIESSRQLEVKKIITTTSFDNRDENIEERQDICEREIIHAWKRVEGASQTIRQQFSMQRTVSQSTKGHYREESCTKTTQQDIIQKCLNLIAISFSN